MGNKNHRWRPGRFQKRLHRCQHLLAGQDVQAARGLVQNQQAWFRDDRPRDQAAYALAAAKRGVRMIRHRLEPHPSQPPLGLAIHLLIRLVIKPNASKVSRENDLARGEGSIDIIRPRWLHETDASAKLGEIGLPKSAAQDVALPDGGPEMAGGDARQRALAAAVGAEDCRQRSGLNGPVDIPQDPSPIAHDTDAAHFHRRLLPCRRRISSVHRHNVKEVEMSANLPSRRFVPRDADPSDFSQLEKLYRELLDRPIPGVPEMNRWLTDFSELASVVDEYGSRRYIDKSCHTEDEAIKKRFLQFVEEVEPGVKPMAFALQKKYLESPLRQKLDRKRYRGA